MGTPTYEILLYGASSFTGALTAKYLDRLSILVGKKWAIAGRTQSKLTELKKSLTVSNPDIVCCSLDNKEAVQDMVSKSRVVLSCAGPYSIQNGRALLGACAQAGVHYSDLSGESFWQREMIDEFDGIARKTGAKIILGGGVDSIPSDLGVYMALKALQSQPEGLVNFRAVYTEYTGAFSGGTLNSQAATRKAISEGRISEELFRDPYLLAPEFCAINKDGNKKIGDDLKVGPDSGKSPSGMPIGWEKTWSFTDGYVLMDFFMAPINARVVRRSFALRGLATKSSYSECCSLGMWCQLIWKWTSSGLGYFLGEPINMKPQSGEGPPSWLIKGGSFSVCITATDDSTGQVLASATVQGKGDPGYGATSKMLAELGLCLAFDEHSNMPQEGRNGGVLTPSTALGDVLVTRLITAEQGDFMSFKVVKGANN